MTSVEHDWIWDDDVVVVGRWLLHRLKDTLPWLPDAAKLIGASEGSVGRRLGNVDAYLGDGKYSNGAKMTREVADLLSTLSRAEVQAEYDAAWARLKAIATTRDKTRAATLPALTDEQRARIAARLADRRRAAR